MLGSEFDHIEDCVAHNRSVGTVVRLLKLTDELKAQFLLARDAERHPAVRKVYDESHDEMVALLAVLRPTLRHPLNAEEKALRERFKHQRNVNKIAAN